MSCERHLCIFRARLCAAAVAACLMTGGTAHAQDGATAPSPPWLLLRGEFRERVEGFRAAGFTEGRDDVYFLSRVRLDARLAPGRPVSAHVQVQDARVARKSVGGTGLPFRAPLDVRMAFVDLGEPSDPVTVRLGRQELAYGDQRLVGHVSWLNSARTFDGARVRFTTTGTSLDVFAVSVVRLLDAALDRSGDGSVFGGAHLTTTRLVPGASIEPYVYWRQEAALATESGGVGEMGVMTTGLRWTGTLPRRWTYGLETVLQTGRVGADRVDAWAGHLVVSTPGVGPLAASATAEYNFASGDRDPADGVRGTFDQLFPTPHDKYGLADQVGWRNVHHVGLGTQLTPGWGLAVRASYHTWWLDEPTDALYAAGGAPLARVPGGAAHGHVGQEIDLQVTRRAGARLQVAAGYAHVIAGAFLREATPGASYSAPYVMATYVFLGE